MRKLGCKERLSLQLELLALIWPPRYRAQHFNFYYGELKMKRLLFAVAVAVVALSYTTGLQAQTGGQATNGSTKMGTKSTGAPKQANLPRCTRARQMAGTPCYGG
jgi:hypothetical protein